MFQACFHPVAILLIHIQAYNVLHIKISIINAAILFQCEGILKCNTLQTTSVNVTALM